MIFDSPNPKPTRIEVPEAGENPPPEFQVSEYWRRTRRLTWQLISIWLGFTFGTIFFARELMTLSFFGWPLSFYMVAQGVVLLYTAIVAGYAWKMKRLDQRFKRGADNVD